jgi:hypothetical protein
MRSCFFSVRPVTGSMRDRIHFVAEHLYPDAVVLVGGEHLDHIPPGAETPSFKPPILAAVLHLDKPAQNRVPGNLLPLLQKEKHPVIRFRRPQAVNARNAGYDDAVPALKERAGSGVAQAVYLVVDECVLFDVGVGRCYVSLGLIVVVVRYEILDRIPGEKRLELAVELGCQGLVVCENQGGPADGFNHLGHRESLARPGHSQQHLVFLAVVQTSDKLVDCLALVSPRRETGAELEFRRLDQRLPIGDMRIGQIVIAGGLLCHRSPLQKNVSV